MLKNERTRGFTARVFLDVISYRCELSNAKYLSNQYAFTCKMLGWK